MAKPSAKPSIAELLNASGYTTYTPELVQRAMFVLYGNVGANLDARNWTTILQSGNALEAADAGLKSMYQDRAYLLNNIAHLTNQGYVPAQAEITYRQLGERLGFSHDTGWSAGTAYAELGSLSMSQLVAMVPVVTPSAPPATTFTVTNTNTNGAGTLAFGGTATGDITFTVAADGVATFVRGGITAATKPNVNDITTAGGNPIKLAANATGLEVATAVKLLKITGFNANGKTYSISDTAAAAVANVETPITGAVNVTVTDAVAVANANTIDTKTTGVVTATISGTDATTLAGLTAANNAYTIVVTSTATAAQLNAINAATTLAVNATGVTAIAGTAAEVITAYTAGGIAGLGNETVTVSDETSAAQAQTILNATTGAVTVGLAKAYTTGSSLTVAIGDVINIDPLNGITALEATAVGNVGAVTSAGQWFFDSGSKLFTWWDNSESPAAANSITLTGAGSVTVAGDTVTIGAGAGAGFAVTTGGSGAYTVGIENGDVVVTESGTNFVFTPASGSAVNVAKGDLGGVLTVGGGIKLTGAAAVLNLLTGIAGAVTVSDAANAALTAAALSAIGGLTSGVVTVTNAVAITGTAAEVTAALVTPLTQVIAATANVTINGAVVLADLINIHNATFGTVTIEGGVTAETWDFGSFIAGDLVINGLGGNDTITSGSGNDTINGGEGDDTITGSSGDDTISGGNGSDTITGGLGKNTITGDAGNDTLTGGANNDTITGGTGNDTITLVTGSDVVVFEATAAGNGLDTIAGFNAGALASGGDVLKVSAFLGTPTLTAVVLDTATGNQAVANGNILRVTDAGDDLTTVTIAALFGGGSKPFGAITASDKYVLITNTGKVWFIDTALDGTAADLTATDIVLVGTIGTVDLSALVSANFA